MLSAIAQSLSHRLASQSISLAHTTLMQVAAIGSLVKLLGNGEHRLHGPVAHRSLNTLCRQLLLLRHHPLRCPFLSQLPPLLWPLQQIDIAHGIDKATMPLAKKTTDSFERAQSLTSWQGVVGHSVYFFSAVVVRVRPFLASLLCWVRMNSSLASS